jgi:hypothetical protein
VGEGIQVDGTITLKRVSVSTKPKKRNKRAFKLWDSKSLTTIMINASEIVNMIENLSDKENLPIEELNNTQISTALLYMFVAGYLDLYNKLLTESLIKTGNVKSTSNIH